MLEDAGLPEGELWLSVELVGGDGVQPVGQGDP